MSSTTGPETIQREQIPLVTMQGVDVVNDGNLILSNVDVTIGKGEFVYLLGKVGSGKSSIIKTLIAELPLKKGKAEVAGFNLWKIKKRRIPYLRRKLGVVFQDFQLLMDRTVEDNLLFVMEATGWKRRKEMAVRAKEVLAMVGMQEKIYKMPHQLSGGEQQRVAIARALLNNPQVILADEPTGNLDEDTAADIMNLLMEIHEKQQPAILMVTHNRELYKRYPGRVLICEEGKVREMEQEIEFSPFDLPEVADDSKTSEVLEVLPDSEVEDVPGLMDEPEGTKVPDAADVTDAAKVSEVAETSEAFEVLDAEECVSDVGMQMDFAEPSEDMESGETAEADAITNKD